MIQNNTNLLYTSFTLNADASENTGASSLISVTKMLTVAVEDIPPTSVALTIYKYIIIASLQVTAMLLNNYVPKICHFY